MITLDGVIFSLQEHGGIGVYFGELFKRLILAEIDVELLLLDKKSVHSRGDNYNHRGEKNIYKRVLERYRRCAITDETSLFHSSYYRLPQSSKLPVITTVYDFIYEQCNSGIKLFVHSSQKRAAIREASAVICISENTRKDLFKFFPDTPAEKVRVIPLAGSDSFQPIEIEPDTSNKRPFVLFVGSRAGYKNFKLAVDAVGLLTEPELRCVGGGAFTKLELIFLEKVIPGRYCHEGMVNNNDLNYLYNNALCLLYPSSYEGFGIPLLEAMQAGCPVVALNSSSIPEVAGDAGILIDSALPELFSKAIEMLMEDMFRDNIRHKGFHRSRIFSWNETYKQTVQVYEEVLGQSLQRHSGLE